MATMNKVIEYVDSVKPNVYSEEAKCKWMSTLDGMISTEVMEYDSPLAYEVPRDADRELLVPHPYDDIYALYVEAMIDFHNKEMDNYNNTVLMFSERLEKFKAWYIQRNPVCKARNFRNVMG